MSCSCCDTDNGYNLLIIAHHGAAYLELHLEPFLGRPRIRRCGRGTPKGTQPTKPTEPERVCTSRARARSSTGTAAHGSEHLLHKRRVEHACASPYARSGALCARRSWVAPARRRRRGEREEQRGDACGWVWCAGRCATSLWLLVLAWLACGGGKAGCGEGACAAETTERSAAHGLGHLQHHA